MVYYKQTDFTINISAQPRVRANLNAVVYSYDEHVNKFVFHLISENNLPIDLTGCKIKILLQYAKEDGTTGTYLDDINGKVENLELQYVSYELANEMRYYVGQVAMNIYIDLKTGEKIDVYDVIFTMRKSEIDDAVSEAPDFYVASFEEITKQVQNTANTEIKKIEAELPKTQASLDKVNSDIASLQKKVDEVAAKNPVKPFQAWANSEDGKTDFTKIKPLRNLVRGNIENFMNWSFIKDSAGLNSLGEKVNNTLIISGDSEHWKQFKTLENDEDNEISKIGAGTFTLSAYVSALDDRAVGSDVTMEVRLNTSTSFKRFGLKSFKLSKTKQRVSTTITLLGSDFADVTSIILVLGFNSKGKALFEKIKFEESSIMTPYIPNKIEDRYASFMKFIGFSNRDSSNYLDYSWVRSEESLGISYQGWSSSEDGKSDFSRVYPRANLIGGNYSGFKDWLFSYGSSISDGKGSILTNGILQVSSATNSSDEFSTDYRQYTLRSTTNEGSDLKTLKSGTFTISMQSRAQGAFVGKFAKVELRKIAKSDNSIKVLGSASIAINQNWISGASTFFLSDSDLVDLNYFELAVTHAGRGVVQFSKVKLENSSVASFFVPNSRDTNVKQTDLFPKYQGLSTSNSVDYLDYSWRKSEVYRDYELQQIRTAITAMGGTL